MLNVVSKNKNINTLTISDNCKGSNWMYVVTIDTVKTYKKIEKEMKQLVKDVTATVQRGI